MLVLDVPAEMIVFDSKLESWFDKAVKSHCKEEKEKSIPATAYFLIGSFCSDGDIHVAYVAKCPLPGTADDSVSKKGGAPSKKTNIRKKDRELMLLPNPEEGGDKLSKTLDDEWLNDCAEKITRMLPGGVNIVGLTWFSNKNFFNEQRVMITRAIARIQRTNNALTTLNITNVNDNMGLVYVETPNGKPQGVIIDVVKRGPESPTKVSFSQLEWISIVTNASTKVVLNIPFRGNHPDFYKEFHSAVRPFAENLFSCDMLLIDGAIRENSEPLFENPKKKKANSIEVQIFIDPCYNKENKIVDKSADNLHEITFDMEIRAAVPVRSKIEAVKTAAKHHLIRSLMARAELQYESMDCVEGSDEEGPCSVHQLPRIATTLLPVNGSVLVQDYLFEADSIEDAQKNFKEILELDTNIEHVDDGWERALLPEEMESVRAPLDSAPLISLKPNDDDISLTPVLVVLAIIVAVVSIVVYLAMGNSS